VTGPAGRHSPHGSPARRRIDSPAPWTELDAERHLRSLELFGMRFGLDRMRRMMTVLDSPQRKLRTIHVVGTNGKSSTARMIAAILERHGLHTGAYLSPHLTSYAERLQIGERALTRGAFAAAIARAAWAAERVDRTLAEDDHVTQFELLTAAALWAMAERGVQVAVVEAGLGGRYDATNVIDARVVVLTNVGLEHTRWLGPTLTDIATEKLAVLRAGATLVLGADLAAEALVVAERIARERTALLVRARDDASVPPVHALGRFQRRNFALARLAAETQLREQGIPPRADLIRAAAAAIEVPGRLQVLEGEPTTVLDGAHNPDAAAALVESLPDLLGDRPLALVLGVLEDKDAASMLRTLLPACERAWFTAPPSPRALPPATLESLARQLGFDATESEPRPGRALSAARAWARERGAAVLASGSVYLVGELLAQESASRGGPTAGEGPTTARVGRTAADEARSP
jgi:dihydrofolate synthase / folylpolyglutamate synthase